MFGTFPDRVYTNWPEGNPEDGMSKFALLPWNNGYMGKVPYPTWIAQEDEHERLSRSPVRWDNMLKTFKAKPSTAAITFCKDGEYDNNVATMVSFQYANYGSHMRGGKGGTNVLLLDGHVEWVPGTQVGYWWVWQ